MQWQGVRLSQAGSRRSALGAWALLVWLVMPTVVSASTDQRLLEALGSPGHVLLIRHAVAPGFGDPEGFRLDDCTTQRNLSEVGRDKARGIGEWLRSRGVDAARVYSSQWCRCLDTAGLLELGPVTPLTALNSFFEMPEDREPNLAALRTFLAAQPRDGELLVLVTHQMTITAVTDVSPESGHGVLMRLGEAGELHPVGQLDFAD